MPANVLGGEEMLGWSLVISHLENRPYRLFILLLALTLNLKRAKIAKRSFFFHIGKFSCVGRKSCIVYIKYVTKPKGFPKPGGHCCRK